MDFPSQTRDLGLYHSTNKDDTSATIRERFNIRKPDSWIGNTLLSLGESTEKTEFLSHVFDQLLQKGNQSVLLWGHRDVSVQLVELARNGKKKSKVLSGCIKLETVMKSFCMAGVEPTMGRWVEYQYSASGRMIGLKFIDYAFQKHLVSACLYGGKTFTVFYELLHGLDAETKQQLQLGDVGSFAYLSGAAPLQRSSTLGRRLTLGRSKSVTKSTVTVDPQTLQHDAQQFQLLVEHMKSLGMGKRTQAQIWTVLAAILHVGNLVFMDDETKPNDPCTIKNPEVLHTVCGLLGINHERLQNTLVYKSKRVGRDTFSSCLKAKEAESQRDTLAACLYGLLVHWIVEHINTRLCKPDHEIERVLGVGSFPWLAQYRDSKLLESLYGNYIHERMTHFLHGEWFDDLQLLLQKDGVSVSIPDYKDNQIVIDLFDGTAKQSGIWDLLDRGLGLEIQNESTLGKEIALSLDDQLKANPCFVNSQQCQRIIDSHGNAKPLFGVKHFNATLLDYDLDMFLEEDCALGDFVSLFKSEEETFVGNLFSKANGLRVGKDSGNATMEIKRRPSLKGKSETNVSKTHFIKCKEAMDELIDSIYKTDIWHILSLDPLTNGQYDSVKVDTLLQKWSIRELVTWKAKLDVKKGGMPYDEFIHKYGSLITITNATRGAMTSKDQVIQFIKNQWWSERDSCFGNTKIWLGASKWDWLHGEIKRLDGTLEEERRLSALMDPARPISGISGASGWNDDDHSDAESMQESEYHFEPKPRKSKLGDPELGKPTTVAAPQKREIVEKEEKLTFSRKCWTCCTWSLTWWVPSFCLSWCGGMKRPDIRMAWREKLALCIIIFLLCASLIFFIVGLRFVICPPINVLTESEIRDLRNPRVGTRPLQPWFSVYGRYIDATQLMDSHKKSYGKGSGGIIDDFLFEDFYGQDVSRLFYRQDAWEFYCPGIPRPPEGWDNMDPNLDWQNRRSVNEQFRSVHRNSFNGIPQLYVDNLLQYSKGRVGWSLQTIKALSSDTKVPLH
jgi:chitin synthase